jgi:hypothetical protein
MTQVIKLSNNLCGVILGNNNQLYLRDRPASGNAAGGYSFVY